MDYPDELRNKYIKKIIQTQGRENIVKFTTEFWRKVSVDERAPNELVEIALDKIAELRNEEISDYDLVYIFDEVRTIISSKFNYQQMYDYLTKEEDPLDVKGYFCPQEDED